MCFVDKHGMSQPCSCKNDPIEYSKPTGEDAHKCRTRDGSKLCMNYTSAPTFHEYFAKGDPCFPNDFGARVSHEGRRAAGSMACQH